MEKLYLLAGLLLILLLTVPFGASWWLRYSTRTQQVLEPRPVETPGSFQLVLADAQRSALTNLALIYVMMTVMGVVACLIVWFRLYVPLSQKPASPLRPWHFVAFAGMLAVLLAGLSEILVGEWKRALRIASQAPPLLSVGPDGLRLPLFSLLNPAFTRAVEAGVDHIELEWGDIQRWSVERRRGQVPAHYEIEVTGASARWGRSTLPVRSQSLVRVRRDHLGVHDAEVVEAARRYLSCPIAVNDQPILED